MATQTRSKEARGFSSRQSVRLRPCAVPAIAQAGSRQREQSFGI